MSGLIPNTLDSQKGAPQGHIAGGIRIENNDIHDNNNLNAPAYSLAYAVYGTGISVVGGVQNDIVDNNVSNQQKYGIVVGPMPDQNFYQPEDNAVMRNTVKDSGRADLALSAPASNNRFAENEFDTSRPMMIERSDGSFRDPYIFLQMFKDYIQGESGGKFLHGETADQPLPDEETLGELPEMEDPENEPPKSPIGGRA
ncbi:MAG: hypothetical protein U5K37_12975 [Natrialbaceae archaeon]|nr:hypothetical protein [Natrialbaceae archaeon]